VDKITPKINYYTDAEKAEIKRLAADGKSPEQIADLYRRTPEGIKHLLRRVGK